MNTYNLTLSSSSPQPEIPGLSQSPPIANDDLWYLQKANLKGNYTGAITKTVIALNGEMVDGFITTTNTKYDWSGC